MTQCNLVSRYSKVIAKNRITLPRAVCEHLRIRPGDQLRYLIDADGVRIEKDNSRRDSDPFIAFSEWNSVADDEAFADL